MIAVALLCSSVPLLLCGWRLCFAFVSVVRLGAGAVGTFVLIDNAFNAVGWSSCAVLVVGSLLRGHIAYF